VVTPTISACRVSFGSNREIKSNNQVEVEGSNIVYLTNTEPFDGKLFLIFNGYILQ
jgi:hypothetical protein